MNYLTTEIETRNDISSIIGLGDTLSSEKLTISNELIRSDLVEMIEEKLRNFQSH